MTLPSFETKDLLLKELTLEYVEAYQKHFNNFDIIKNLPSTVPWPYPQDGAKDHIENHIMPEQEKTIWAWGIFLKESPDDLIGAISIRQGDDNRGFWLSQDYWGKGYMTQALKPVTDYAFNDLGFDELKLSNVQTNVASHKLKARTGGKLIGYDSRQSHDGRVVQSELWVLTKKDWFESQK